VAATTRHGAVSQEQPTTMRQSAVGDDARRRERSRPASSPWDGSSYSSLRRVKNVSGPAPPSPYHTPSRPRRRAPSRALRRRAPFTAKFSREDTRNGQTQRAQPRAPTALTTHTRSGSAGAWAPALRTEPPAGGSRGCGAEGFTSSQHRPLPVLWGCSATSCARARKHKANAQSVLLCVQSRHGRLAAGQDRWQITHSRD
jgi:hypothetical protein